MAGVAECGWAGGPGSVSCSHAETQTDLPACCGSFIISLMEKLALAQGKLPSDNGPWPAVTAALPSAAPAADPAVAEQTGTGAAGRTELADDNTLEQGLDVELQAPDQPVTDSLKRSAGEASQEAQTAPRTGSTVAAPQAVVTAAGVQLNYDEDLDMKIEEFDIDASQQGAAPEPDGQTTPEAGSSSAPADGPAAHPQPQPPQTARRRPASAGSSADIGAVGAKLHAGSLSHCCPQCGRAFTTRGHLQHHELTHTGKRLFGCEECGKTFTQKGTLNIHRRTHTGERPFACEVCGKTFTQKSALKTHRRTHTGEKSYSCEVCGKTFGHKVSLVAHHHTHTGEQPYSCEECGEKFSNKSKIKRHRRTHTGERPFSCEECGRTFTEKSTLIGHRRIHTGERPFSCDECGRTFRQRNNLSKHRRTHTAERPFSCDECGRTFRQRNNLSAHRRTHTGERPFSCEECGRTFTEKSTLIGHRRIHTGERPFSCDECGRTFRQRNNLSAHRRTHTGERPSVRCSCGQIFSPQTALSNSSERQLQCAACEGSAALKEQDLQAPPQPPPVKQEPPEPEQSADPLATTDLTAVAGPSTAASGLAGRAGLQTASGSYGAPEGISAGSVPACNEPGPYQTAQDLPNSSLRSCPGNRGHLPAPVVKATENEDSDVADDPYPELEGDDSSEPQRDLSYRGRVSSQRKKSTSKKTTPRSCQILDSSDGDESPLERRVTPARSAKQRNSVQATNLKSQGSGEGSDSDADQFDFSGSESSWRDSSAESSEEG